MKQTSIARKILVGLGVALFCLPATAQLSLSAGAKAKADKDGAKASTNGDADAKSDEAKAEAKPVEAKETKESAEVKAEPTAEPVAETEAKEEAVEKLLEEPAPPVPAETPEADAPMAENEIDQDFVEVDVVAPDTSGVTGYDGGFFIKTNDGNFKLKINGRTKARWTFLNDEWGVMDPQTGEAGTNHTMHSKFEMPYARVILSGHAFDPRLGYCLYWDFGSSKPIYAWASWDFIPKKLQIKAGLFKVPMSRWYLTSSAKRGFIQAPTGDMGGTLDTGIQVSNDFEKASGVEWAIGVFNGTMGTNYKKAETVRLTNADLGVNGEEFALQEQTNGDFSPRVMGRIGYNNGIKGYDDADFEGGPFRYGVAFSASTEFNHDGNDNKATHKTTHYLALDGMMKVHGLTVSAAGTLQSAAKKYFWEFDDNDGLNQSGLAKIGTYLQGGYILKEHFEPNARYSLIHDSRKKIDEDLKQEITAGFTFHFFKKHAFKLENNLTLFLERGLDGAQQDYITYKDIVFSSQLEFNF